ncbi:MAG: PilZ domain-containing protein [Desulfobulbales bacterium]
MSDETGKACQIKNQEEQRNLKRHRLIYYLRVYDGISSKVVGHVVDISPHGLQLITDEPIPVQEEYRLRMRFPGTDSSLDELIFDAVCRWCHQDENPAFYLAGFQIQNLMPDEANFIQGMIHEFGV